MVVVLPTTCFMYNCSCYMLVSGSTKCSCIHLHARNYRIVFLDILLQLDTPFLMLNSSLDSTYPFPLLQRFYFYMLGSYIFVLFCRLQYFTPVLMQGNFTGPKIFWSGSSFRTEATGYGLVKWYFNFSFEQIMWQFFHKVILLPHVLTIVFLLKKNIAKIM